MSEEKSARLQRPLLVSSLAHGLALCAAFGLAYVKLHAEKMGDPNPGGSGSVSVDAVDRIPLPKREAPENKVAQDTKSEVPQSKPEPVKQEREDPEAVALEGKPKVKPQAPRPAVTRPPSLDPPPRPNVVPNPSGPQMSSDLYGIPGPGGVGIGKNSVLGSRFGAYADLIRKRVAEKWSRTGLRTGSEGSIAFDLSRDGTVSEVKIVKTSGNYLMDRSMQRAVLDAAPFPRFPAGLNDSKVPVEFLFEVK